MAGPTWFCLDPHTWFKTPIVKVHSPVVWIELYTLNRWLQHHQWFSSSLGEVVQLELEAPLSSQPHFVVNFSPATTLLAGWCCTYLNKYSSQKSNSCRLFVGKIPLNVSSFPPWFCTFWQSNSWHDKNKYSSHPHQRFFTREQWLLTTCTPFMR